MDEQTEDRLGYRYTHLGWIPKEWGINKLGKIFKITAGGDLNKKNYFKEKFSTYKYPIFSNKLTNNGLYGYSNEYDYDCECISITARGMIGKAINRNNKFCAIGRLLILIPVIKLDTYFVSEYINNSINFLIESTGVPQLTAPQTSTYLIALPPLQEQKTIADCLSQWDKAIDLLTRLIEQKKLRKKGLMQQLLTGKKRLPGFDGEWKHGQIGDVTKLFSRRNKKLIDARIYSISNLKGFIYQSEQFEREVAGDDLANYKIIKKNEFAYNPARINVGSIAYFEDEIGIISSLYVCFSTNKLMDDIYFSYLLSLNKTKHDICRYGEGGVRIYLWYPLFSSIKIIIPSHKEQTAISKVLQTADKEINLLNKKLGLLKEQKKGLMQQLLTGKKRLTIKTKES